MNAANPQHTPEAHVGVIGSLLDKAPWKDKPAKEVEDLRTFVELLLRYCHLTAVGKTSQALQIHKELTTMRIEGKVPEAELVRIFVGLSHIIPNAVNMSAVAAELPPAFLRDLLTPALVHAMKRNLETATSAKSLFTLFKEPYKDTAQGKFIQALQDYLKSLLDAKQLKHTTAADRAAGKALPEGYSPARASLR